MVILPAILRDYVALRVYKHALPVRTTGLLASAFTYSLFYFPLLSCLYVSLLPASMLMFPFPTRWLVLLVACLANLTPTYSQDFAERDKAVAQPPSGKGLGTAVIGGIPVNLFTGTASPGYPLCELPRRNLTIPISLNYVAGNGVQVTSVASEVGTGWALTAGGSISCEVHGRPDEFDTEPKTWLTSLINRTGGTELADKICRSCVKGIDS